jgi:hypothetical protein
MTGGVHRDLGITRSMQSSVQAALSNHPETELKMAHCTVLLNRSRRPISYMDRHLDSPLIYLSNTNTPTCGCGLEVVSFLDN